MDIMPANRKNPKTTTTNSKKYRVTQSLNRRTDSPSDDPDSSDAESETPAENRNTTRSGQNRRSGRLKERSSRSFRLPSREEIWDQIPNTPLKRLSCDDVRPRRLVNNFTKENSRYNYDPAYTSGEESIEEFLVPDDEVDYEEDSSSSSSSGEDEGDKPNTNGGESTSTSETAVKTPSHRRPGARHAKPSRKSSSSESSNSASDTSEYRQSSRNIVSKKSKPVILYSASSDEGSPAASPRKKLCKRRSRIEHHSSESEDTRDDNDCVKKGNVRIRRLRPETTGKPGQVSKHFHEHDGGSAVKNIDVDGDSIEMSREDFGKRKRKTVIESSSSNEWSTDNDIPLIDDRTLENGVKNASVIGTTRDGSHNSDTCRSVVDQSGLGKHDTSNIRTLDSDNSEHDKNKGIEYTSKSSFLKAEQSKDEVSDEEDEKRRDQSESDHNMTIHSDKCSRISSGDDSADQGHSKNPGKDSENDSETENVQSRRKERSCTKINRTRRNLFSELRTARKRKSIHSK